MTGRPRRCGWFDANVVRYSVRVNGLTGLAVTKLDVLDTFGEIPVGTGYKIDGELTEELPAEVERLERVKPVYEVLPGWKRSTEGARRMADLPAAGACLPRPAAGPRRRPDPLRERGDAAGPDHRGVAMADTTLMDKLVSLCKRRGFVFQSSEIYGGLGSVWDYGPLGVELKKNVKDRWWRAMVHARDDIEGLDAAILMHPKVWEASGPRRGLHRPAGRLQELQGALPRRQDRGRAVPAEAEQAPGRAQHLRAHRAAPVQPDVQDLHGPGRGGRGGRLPAPRDGAGDLRQLPERPAGLAGRRCRSASRRSARRSATRSRPATSSSAPASSSRWRCSSS